VLVDALRREKETRTEIERVRSQVTALEELVAAKEADTQRLSMMVKLKEARLASLASTHARNASTSSSASVSAMTSTIDTMNQEIELLKSALSQKTSSEVKRFAVENLQLRHQLASTQRADDTDQILSHRGQIDTNDDVEEEKEEIAALRDALLRTGEALEQADAQITHLRETLETERSMFKERDTLCCSDNAVSSALRLEAAEAAACREREEAERWCAHSAQLESKCESLEKSLRIAQEDEGWFVQSVLGELVQCWNQETSQRWEMEEREERYRMERCRMVDSFEQQIKELRQTHRKEIVAAELETLEAKEAVKRVKIDLEACKSRLHRAQEGRTELEEALARADDTRVDLEYRLSDVSAELTEVKQRNSGLVTSVKELGIFRRRVIELEDQLAEARLAAQAVVGPLERQREISVVRDELRIAQATLEVVREEAAALAGVVKKKDEELARLRADMAAEVNDAALQVQELLLAQERAEAAEARVRELEEQTALSAAGMGEGRS